MSIGASDELLYITRSREADNRSFGPVGERVYAKDFDWKGLGGEISKGENRHGLRITTSLAPTAREGANLSFESQLVFGLNFGPAAKIAVAPSNSHGTMERKAGFDSEIRKSEPPTAPTAEMRPSTIALRFISFNSLR